MDKPTGPTSHDVVSVVRRAIGERRVGHTGTLDPFASGLLVLLAGRATRLAQFLVGHTKSYRGVIRLGTTTDSCDATGTVTGTNDTWTALNEAHVTDDVGGACAKKGRRVCSEGRAHAARWSSASPAG